MANEDRLPQFDRAKIKTPIGFFSTLFRLMRISEEFAIPAIVKKYDRSTGIVKVQPIVSNLADDINNQEIEIPRSEYDVHVVRFAHGGYVVDAPLFVGDTGWLIAGDRNSTSAIKANSTILKEDQDDENSPNEGYKKPDDNSLKSFAWGFFIPDTWGITDFTEEDGLVVRGQRISVESDHVTIECGDNSASISKESVNIDTKKCSVEVKEGSASVISGRYGAKIDENSAIVEGPNDKISIDDKGLHHEGVIDEKRNVISAIKYDKEIGDIVKKSFLVSKRGDFIVDIDEETDWERLGLPSANDGKLTIKQGNDTLGTFTANQASDTTIIIPEPPTPPAPVVPGNGTITITQGSTTLGSFSVNQTENATIPIPVPPTPPTPITPGDGTLTITQGSTTLGTFTANQTGDTTIPIPAIPESLPNPHSLRVYGNPTSNAGTEIASPDPTTYNGSAQTDIHLDGLLTKGTAQSITADKTFSGANNTSKLRFQVSDYETSAVNMIQFSNKNFDMWVGNSDVAATNFLSFQQTHPDGKVLTLGTNDANCQRLRIAPTTDPNATGYNALQIDTVGAANGRFQQKLTAGSNITISNNTISATQPTVNNKTITITQGSTTLGSFTLNQSDDETISIPEPPTPPAPVVPGNGTITITQGSATLGTFTANQSTNTTVTIPEPPTVNDGTLSLTLGSQTKTFSANQKNNVSLTVPAKRLIAGTNISIAVNGNDITISSSGGGGTTSGFSGTRRTLALTRYDISTNQLQAKYFTETWSNGLMTASTIDSAWSMIEGGQAVMETV